MAPSDCVSCLAGHRAHHKCQARPSGLLLSLFLPSTHGHLIPTFECTAPGHVQIQPENYKDGIWLWLSLLPEFWRWFAFAVTVSFQRYKAVTPSHPPTLSILFRFISVYEYIYSLLKCRQQWIDKDFFVRSETLYINRTQLLFEEIVFSCMPCMLYELLS